ncbi:MAG: transglutaminase-like domain-containing protein, partial [Acidipropionibacterium jensenii]|nr:transglutaminase-like domain-containing protein [Acidipropionibacterium jensenii]
FTYSTSAPPGDGFDVMTNFLTRSRSGYCIHFAAAMALMARVEGIPSRVSIGFLPGTRTNGAWQVRGSNMHAWPELYFQGYGWVRYEPTAAVGQSPTWSVQNPNSVPQTQSSADATESASAAATPSAPSASTSAGAASSAPASSQESGPSLPWRTILMSLAGVLVVALLACTPMLLRAGRRRRRLSSGDPSALVAGAWREVHDSWTDHGLSWAALSPRAQFAAVSDQLGPEGAAALGRLAGAEERARYARSLGEIGDVGGDVEVIRKGLAAADTPRAHWLATWWPRSLWHR